MLAVYEADHLIDAHLVRGRLQAEGIAAFVQGEWLTGALGELPLGGLLRVCVDEADAERACALLDAWQAEPIEAVGDDDGGLAAEADGELSQGALRA